MLKFLLQNIDVNMHTGFQIWQLNVIAYKASFSKKYT